jgi:hypothetical protein
MQTQVLNIHKEIIIDTLRSNPVGKPGIFDLDVEFYKKELRESERFYLFCFNGPFQDLSPRFGLQEALVKFVHKARHTTLGYKDYVNKIIARYEELTKNGYKFDGVWMWEDMAYNDGLFFSLEKYRSQLFDIHKEICEFFKSQNLPLFFHCDGRVEKLIPFLIDAGVKAVHPVQESCNGDIIKLKKQFQGLITFVGGVGIDRIRHDKKELFDYIRRLNEGGNYIFSFDAPIEKEYENILKDIELELTRW